MNVWSSLVVVWNPGGPTSWRTLHSSKLGGKNKVEFKKKRVEKIEMNFWIKREKENTEIDFWRGGRGKQ